MKPILTLRYEPEKGDYISAARILARNSPGFMIVAGVILFAMAGSAAVLVFPEIGGEALRNIATIIFLFSLVYVLYFLFLIPFQLSRSYKANAHLRNERQLTFFESHLLMSMGQQSIELPWEGIKRVVDGGTYYLLIFQGDEKIYPFIPGRAFKDEKEKQAFLVFLQSKSIPVI